ncbi:MAG: isochorismatase family protein [Pirellulaceae bacterium]|nr:isochorismatase family protein [Pirellulaceae bacterium]
MYQPRGNWQRSGLAGALPTARRFRALAASGMLMDVTNLAPPSSTSLARSPELMNRDDSALLVVDVQAKLLPLVPGGERLVWNIRRLIDAARILGLPVLATEQYPQGLGPTTAVLAQRLDAIPAKLAFSCGERGELFQGLSARGIWKILVCGLETHVCVSQTVHDLLGEGFRVFVAADAVAARGMLDHEIALRRMDSAGATLTTVEAALFEWCGRAGTPEFKQISQLVREQPPA